MKNTAFLLMILLVALASSCGIGKAFRKKRVSSNAAPTSCNVKYFQSRSSAARTGRLQPLCNVSGESGFGGSLQQAINSALQQACACSGVTGAYAANLVDGGSAGGSVAQLVGFRFVDGSVAEAPPPPPPATSTEPPATARTSAAPSTGQPSAVPQRVGPLPFSEVALLPLRPKAVKSNLVSVVDDLLPAGLHTAAEGRLKIIGKSDIDAMMNLEDMKDAMGCDDVACAAEIAGALGVEHVVAGSLGRLGKEHVLTLNLINTGKQSVLHRHTHKLGTSPDEFFDSVDVASRAFLAGASRTLYGR